MIWGYILGGATIFALIVGLFSLYNGRVTRREITRVIVEVEKRTQEMLVKLSDQHNAIVQEGKRTREILGKLSDQHSAMVEILRSMQGSGRKE